MATYTVVCDQGHEPVTMTAEADSDEQAVEMLLEQGKAHNIEKHPDMQMSDEDFKAYIMTHWSKS